MEIRTIVAVRLSIIAERINAKKAKISKKVVMTQLQPQLDEIDGKLEILRTQYDNMTTA